MKYDSPIFHPGEGVQRGGGPGGIQVKYETHIFHPGGGVQSVVQGGSRCKMTPPSSTEGV